MPRPPARCPSPVPPPPARASELEIALQLETEATAKAHEGAARAQDAVSRLVAKYGSVDLEEHAKVKAEVASMAAELGAANKALGAHAEKVAALEKVRARRSLPQPGCRARACRDPRYAGPPPTSASPSPPQPRRPRRSRRSSYRR